MKVYARVDEILKVRCFLNRLSTLDFGATYIDRLTGDTPPPPPFLLKIFNGELAMIAYAKFKGFLNVGYIINGFKWILSLR